MKRLIVLLAMIGLFTDVPANETEVPPLLVTRCVDVTLDEMWQAWTTAEGVQSFFSRGSIVEPRIDGDYSILFFPDNPPGTRGAEGMRIVAFEPPRRLVITWNQPPRFENIKEQRALVEFRFRQRQDCGTEVRVKHFGWGYGPEWTAAREYFAGAWVIVLERLNYRFDHGPLDWENLPDHLWYSGPAGE